MHDPYPRQPKKLLSNILPIYCSKTAYFLPIYSVFMGIRACSEYQNTESLELILPA